MARAWINCGPILAQALLINKSHKLTFCLWGINFFSKARELGWHIVFVPWEGMRHEGQYTRQLQNLGVECKLDSTISPQELLLNLDYEFDLVVLSRAPVALQTIDLVRKKHKRAKLIFNTVDLHHLRFAREQQLLESGNKVSLKIRSQFVSEEEELGLVRKSDATIVVSEEEQKILEDNCPSSEIHLIPLFRDVPGTEVGYQQRLNIGFVGGYRHPPNIDAVNFFIAEVLPLIKKKIPEIKFLVAGSNITHEIERLTSSSVEIRGFVDDLRVFLDEVRVMVAPLRYGGGIKGKVVSSLCHGVPQVATSQATEGMSLSTGQGLLVADRAKEIADSVIKIYQSEQLWNEMSDKGIAVARAQFSKEAIAGKISQILKICE